MLMTGWRKEPWHQLPWYGPSWTGITRSPHVKGWLIETRNLNSMKRTILCVVWLYSISEIYVWYSICCDHKYAPLSAILIHWGRYEIASQMAFWNIFFFNEKYHISIQVSLKRNHWFRFWLGPAQPTSHYLNHWFSSITRVVKWNVQTFIGELIVSSRIKSNENSSSSINFE